MKNWNAPEVQELDVKETANGWVASNNEGYHGLMEEGIRYYHGTGGNTETERCVPGEKEGLGS